MGLLKTMVSAGTILGQLLSLGTGHAIIRFFDTEPRSRRNSQLVSFGLALTLPGILMTGLLLMLSYETVFDILQKEDVALMQEHLPEFFVLTIAWTFFQVISGFAYARLKSIVVQFLLEVGIKGGTLLMVLAYLFNWLSFSQLVWAYVAVFIAIFVLLLWYCYHIGLRWDLGWKQLPKRSILTYSGFAALERSATAILANIDILMILALLGDLEAPAVYSVAFYIGTVVLIPQKALLAIANPIVARALKVEDWQDLKQVYQKTALNQLLLGGLIFLLIWINVDDIFSIVGQKFSDSPWYEGVKWVVLFIGLSKLAALISGPNSGIIVYSRFYRFNMYANAGLVFITFFTNLIFIPDYGLAGAAFATMISAALFSAAKIIFVQLRFKVNPFTPKLFFTGLLLVGLIGLNTFWPAEWLSPWAEILLKSSVFGLVYLIVAWQASLSPDIEQLVGKILNWFRR